ncbi:general transcription repressor [Neonectria punicea]|uniref:General transcription repressor n=1 Tax=Neonectria punicea TaxID=979145 RepID=A0ABR1HVQ6_9HYPO
MGDAEDDEEITEKLEPISELQELFQSIPETISTLFKLSVIIRNSSTRDRFAKALVAGSRVPIDPSYDIDHVQNKFPCLRQKEMEWLRTRLGTAITQRRNYLRYCRDHREKMAKVTDTAAAATLETQDAGEDAEARLLNMRGKRSLQATGDSKSQASSQPSTLAPTTASTIIPSQLDDLDILERLDEESNDVDHRSVTSYASSVGEKDGDNRLSVIQFEEIAKPGKPFECPYCWTIQKFNGHHAWRKHVMSDLKPFVCTGEACDMRLFDDSRTWLAHEMENHLVEWQCCFCSLAPFAKLDKFQSHIVKSHGVRLGEDQLTSLSKTCQKPVDQLVPSACRICDTWEETLRTLNRHIPADETLVVTPQQFRHHVCGHMEQLALFTIPRGCWEDEDGESGKRAQGGTHASSERSFAANSETSEYDICENAGRFDAQTMARLLDQKGGQVTVTEKVVVAAAGNSRHGKGVMALLLDRRGHEITITEEVVKAAAANSWNGLDVIAFLLDCRKDEIFITKQVVKAASENMASGKEVMGLLLEWRGFEIAGVQEVATTVAREFDKDVMGWLLDRRSDDIIMTEEIFEAVVGNRRNGTDVMILLLDRLGDADRALLLAAKNGHLELCSRLLEGGANVQVRDDVGRTSLLYAAEHGHEAIVRLLIQNGADVTAKDLKARTPLSQASKNGQEAIIKLLLQHGADFQKDDPQNAESLTSDYVRPRTTSVGNALGDLNVHDLAPNNKKFGQDWNAIFNPQVFRVLDVDLIHSFDHESVVTCVKFNPDGNHLATACNWSAQIFDVQAGERVCVLEHRESPDMKEECYVRGVCFSPDGRYLATSAEDKLIRVWDIETRTIHNCFSGHEQEVYSIDFTRDGRTIASGSRDKTVRLWDIERNICTFKLTTEDGVTGVAISPDMRLVAAGSLDKTIRVWDIQSGSPIYCLEGPDGHQDSVYSVAFSPDSKNLVSGSLDRTIKIWELSAPLVTDDQPGLKEGKCVKTFEGHRDFVLSVTLTPDTKWVLSGSKDREIQFWDLQTGIPQMLVAGHKNSVISVASSPQGGLFATGSGDMRARIWSYRPY